MRSLSELKATIRAGLSKEPCDLLLSNVNLVNVCSHEVYPTNIYIKGKRIVSIDPNAALEAEREIDCNGSYAIPGFIDSHMHFESTMLSPEALADFIVEKGTTTICADMMEIANVCGEQGIHAMLAGADHLPYRILVEVSSRVPTAPGLETNGATMDDLCVAKLMEEPTSISLGELDPSKILSEKEEYLNKIIHTLNLRKIVNGHAIGRSGQELNVYASAGISDDHECVTRNEMAERLRLGIGVFIREGSSERNLDELVQGILDLHLPTENICFCTDDKHVDDIQKEGHINYNVNRAIQLGLSPMEAICMATIYPARHFRLDNEIGCIAPGRIADILLSPSIENILPSCVIYEGKIVFENAEKRFDCQQVQYPEWIYDTVHLMRPITADTFLIPHAGETVQANIIELIPNQIISNWVIADLPVENGYVERDAERDIQKISVVERYGKNGNVSVGFVKGFTIKRGAVAYSMSHDHHNIVVIGTNDLDMAVCVNEICKLHGGLTAALDGKIIASMPLEIGGLMSTAPVASVNEQLLTMNAAAADLGCVLPSPYMTLSFISLPTVPALGITDIGLIDVNKNCVIPLCRE